MTTLPRVRDLQANLSGMAFYLCCQKELRQGARGDFITLTLQDVTGQVLARVFDNVDALRQEFEAGEFVKVQARSQVHNGRLQLIVEKIRRVMESDRQAGFSEEDCLTCAPRPVQEMWGELEAVLAGVADPYIRTLLDRIVRAKEAQIRLWPAAVTVHHAYRGGFLEHVLKVSETARALAAAYGASTDLVTAGALLHDIGKLEELHHDTSTSYSLEGNLVGHITLGAIIVRESCASIPGFPDDLRTQIEHLVVSHHGSREFGSPVEPMTVEAFILSAADDLDAKIHQVRHAVAGDVGEGEFTPYHVRLGRVLYKGARGGTTPVTG